MASVLIESASSSNDFGDVRASSLDLPTPYRILSLVRCFIPVSFLDRSFKLYEVFKLCPAKIIRHVDNGILHRTAKSVESAVADHNFSVNNGRFQAAVQEPFDSGQLGEIKLTDTYVVIFHKNHNAMIMITRSITHSGPFKRGLKPKIGGFINGESLQFEKDNIRDGFKRELPVPQGIEAETYPPGDHDYGIVVLVKDDQWRGSPFLDQIP
ncbi:hypothetical protein pdam_00001780 [Pocillopora damicornis]|uniref:Uncharacterized protein n=1 Tax=Pocillopora damicornis TaxID=46731 RepID=A0A3M6TNF0_POCDA|nr:hypothetical protein pdam_00001780 [Pocillopora damicornis]